MINTIILAPIRLEEQLEDGLGGVSVVTNEAVIAKSQALRAALPHLISAIINGSPVYNVTMQDNKDVYYRLKRGGKQYYYPVQYAQIELMVET